MRRRPNAFGSSGFVGGGQVSGRDADLFMADLLGRTVPRVGEAAEADPGPALEPSGADFPEPFFGDARGQSWKVVGRPGRPFRGLRSGDLIVRRSKTGGWLCQLADDVPLASLYQPGTDRLMRGGTVVLRRLGRFAALTSLEDSGEEAGEIVEVCGFFGPNDVRRTEQQIRNAVVTRANAEWTAWHGPGNASRPEGDAGMFGRLTGYYLAATPGILPDTLLAIQATALGGVNYAPLLAAGASAATIATEVATIRGLLLAGAPGATAAGLDGRVADAIRRARQAHTNAGDFRAWSAAFVSACVRGTAIAEGLEGVIAPGRRHVGRSELLLPTLTHAAYTIEARTRRAAKTPRRRGTYHAFAPAERAPQAGDIIVQDRRDGIPAAQVATLATLAQGLLTHGDIVVEVQPGFVVTVGGNVGDSVRKRRYPRDAQGLLVRSRQLLYTQEDNAGVLPPLPAQSALPLADHSTARIVALLSPVEECAAVPGQPLGGGTLA